MKMSLTDQAVDDQPGEIRSWPRSTAAGIEADFRRENVNREQWTSRQWRVDQRVDPYREYTDKKPERVQTHHIQKMRFLGMKR
jgi:hypothetical protein